MAADNFLYYGDNLDILRRYVKDESVDLVYLDPPFNSNQTYNVLFAEKDGSKSAGQIKAFGDTWAWSLEAERAYVDVVTVPGRVSDALQAFRKLLGPNDMLAYLVMMAPRLVELRRVLKPTGSIYLHCDPTASHYLKILMDAVFEPQNFRNEVIWKRTHAHSGSKRLGPVHDTLFFYTKTDAYTWNPQHTPYSQEYIETFFRFTDPDGRRYRATILTGTGTRNGSSGKPWRGIDPTKSGRHWAVPGYVRNLIGDQASHDVQSALDELDKMGRILWPTKDGGVPSFKQYLDDMEGVVLQDIWVDIPPLSAQAGERLGYPTQKPEALLERIIEASSNEGDVVLDPFCGCGTAISVAQRLKRRWIGIDITHLAITLMKSRLRWAFGDDVDKEYTVRGEPETLPDARALAAEDRFQFQYWALGKVDARPLEEKKGADKGIDGRKLFHDDNSGDTKQVILSVKSGHVSVADIRDLRGVLDREKAEMGVLITLEEPTGPMKTEAASAGFYTSPLGTQHPRLQILTIAELLAGKRIDMPYTRGSNVTFKRAPKARSADPAHVQLALGVGPDADVEAM